MVVIIACLVLLIILVMVFQRLGIKYPYSKGIGIGIALSILAVVSLAQNYTQSLIPEANDGISITNKVAYWIIGKDGWSQEMFKNTFELSTYISLILIGAYPTVLVIESKLDKRTE
jgi:ethanolamine transporter EutH